MQDLASAVRNEDKLQVVQEALDVVPASLGEDARKSRFKSIIAPSSNDWLASSPVVDTNPLNDLAWLPFPSSTGSALMIVLRLSVSLVPLLSVSSHKLVQVWIMHV
jgi:hypothetical protein